MQISSKEKQMINLIAGWGRASASDISASNGAWDGAPAEVQFDIDTADVEGTAAIMKSLHAWLGNSFDYRIERFCNLDESIIVLTTNGEGRIEEMNEDETDGTQISTVYNTPAVRTAPVETYKRVVYNSHGPLPSA